MVLERLQEVRDFIKNNQASYYVLGHGSNIIINPNTTIQKFIKISPEISQLEINNQSVKVSAGTSASKLIAFLTRNGLSGLEFAAGVPASLGGMIAMNFGCWGQAIADLIERVHVVSCDGESVWLKTSELNFGYRTSIFQKHNYIIIEAILKLTKSNSITVQSQVTENIAKRMQNQPLTEKTFGSIFKNPPDSCAGRLLEDLNLKGYAKNNIQISAKHANFLINQGDADFNDIMSFLDSIKNQVKEKKGLNLDLEVQII